MMLPGSREIAFGWLNMRPVSAFAGAVDDATDGGLAYRKPLAKLGLSKTSGGIEGADGGYLILGKLGASLRFTACTTSFTIPISYILLLCAEKKVRRVHAKSVIAAMTDANTVVAAILRN